MGYLTFRISGVIKDSKYLERNCVYFKPVASAINYLPRIEALGYYVTTKFGTSNCLERPAALHAGSEVMTLKSQIAH